MKNNKPLLSKKKKAYLAVAQRVNETLTSDFRISDSSALAMYDKDISPYGYHSHQNMLITEGLAKYFFNKRVAEKNITDQDGNLMLGESFGHEYTWNNLSETNTLCPNFYITDDLANSLIETDTPKGKLDISNEVLPVIKVIFSKKFFKFSKMTIFQVDNGIRVKASIRSPYGPDGFGRETLGCDQIKVTHHAYMPMEFFIPLDGNGHCMLCDTREYFKKNLLHRNYFKIKFSTMDEEYHLSHIDSYGNMDIKEFFGSMTHEFVEAVIEQYIENLHQPYRFVVNLLCLMTQEPEILTVQNSTSKYTTTNSKGFDAEKISNVPNVHWLGQNFTTRVVNSTAASVLQGPGRTQKQLKWFRPTFIRGHAS
jgi:hypothetical protein